jgi:pimeloyl-ACP methyl ester carboxylesterase
MLSSWTLARAGLAFMILVSATPSIADPTTATVEANGLQIFYEEQGQGPPVVLLHGGSLTHRSWQWFAPEAAMKYRVIALDSRGHGQTDNPSGRFSYDLMADDTAAFIAALKLDKPVVIGYSDGGMTALTLAIRHPDVAKAIVVGGATHRFADTDLYFAGMESFYLTRSKGSISDAELDAIEAARPQMVERYKQLHADWRLLLKQVWQMWTTPTVYGKDELAKVTVPVLIVLGDRDDFFAVEDALALHRMLPDSELAIASGASHTFFRDKPALFAAPVMDFLARLYPAP